MPKLNRNQLTRMAADVGLGLWVDYNTQPAAYVICELEDGLPVPSKRLHKDGYTAAQVVAFLAGWEARGRKEREAES